MTQGRQDVVSGAVLLVLSIALYLAIPGQVETLEADTLTPASLPFAVTALIGVLSAVLLFQGIRAGGFQSGGNAGGARGLVHVGLTLVVMGGYAASIPWAGYIPATIAALLLLTVLYGNRNWKQILLILVIAPPLILIFFRYTMLVLLPQGRLFDGIFS